MDLKFLFIGPVSLYIGLLVTGGEGGRRRKELLVKGSTDMIEFENWKVHKFQKVCELFTDNTLIT